MGLTSLLYLHRSSETNPLSLSPRTDSTFSFSGPLRKLPQLYRAPAAATGETESIGLEPGLESDQVDLSAWLSCACLHLPSADRVVSDFVQTPKDHQQYQSQPSQPARFGRMPTGWTRLGGLTGYLLWQATEQPAGCLPIELISSLPWAVAMSSGIILAASVVGEMDVVNSLGCYVDSPDHSREGITSQGHTSFDRCEMKRQDEDKVKLEVG
ncbi:unnamed protein product [Protopolystoma xenopodis]|uniref:Uncharacterized protein n=1 Tax=Protopolystoma xenopodis TaxID=117903 RepID=A0A3S5FCT0_9PLAT|nr:unnamed protein product [Protopolystoma xenopodis]